jgi:hypothetical protein
VKRMSDVVAGGKDTVIVIGAEVGVEKGICCAVGVGEGDGMLRSGVKRRAWMGRGILNRI